MKNKSAFVRNLTPLNFFKPSVLDYKLKKFVIPTLFELACWEKHKTSIVTTSTKITPAEKSAILIISR